MTAFGLTSAFWASYVLLWGVVVLFGLLIVLIYRQFGLVFMRPAERVRMQGLDVNSTAPSFSLTDQRGREHQIAFGPEAGTHQATVVVFALPTCEICAGLAMNLAELPREQPDARFVWVDGTSPRPPRGAIHEARGWISGSAHDDAVHQQWDVSAVPFCFVVASTGRISDKRLVNRREDLELALGIGATSASPSPHQVQLGAGHQ